MLVHCATNTNSCMQLTYYKYNAKFSRYIISMFFTNWLGTTKFKRHKSLSVYTCCILANSNFLIHKNCFHKNLETVQSVKIVHLENLALYSIISTTFGFNYLFNNLHLSIKGRWEKDIQHHCWFLNCFANWHVQCMLHTTM